MKVMSETDNFDNTTNRTPAGNGRFHASGGVCTQKHLWEFGSLSSARPLCPPHLREAAPTLGASDGRHSRRRGLKANSGNDYREMVTRRLAVLNPFAKAKKLYLTWWQDTREAVREGLIIMSLKSASQKFGGLRNNPGGCVG